MGQPPGRGGKSKQRKNIYKRVDVVLLLSGSDEIMHLSIKFSFEQIPPISIYKTSCTFGLSADESTFKQGLIVCVTCVTKQRAARSIKKLGEQRDERKSFFSFSLRHFQTKTSDIRFDFLTGDVESVRALTPCDGRSGVPTAEPSVLVTLTA